MPSDSTDRNPQEGLLPDEVDKYLAEAERQNEEVYERWRRALPEPAPPFTIEWKKGDWRPHGLQPRNNPADLDFQKRHDALVELLLRLRDRKDVGGEPAAKKQRPNKPDKTAWQIVDLARDYVKRESLRKLDLAMLGARPLISEKVERKFRRWLQEQVRDAAIELERAVVMLCDADKRRLAHILDELEPCLNRLKAERFPKPGQPVHKARLPSDIIDSLDEYLGRSPEQQEINAVLAILFGTEHGMAFKQALARHNKKRRR